MIQFHNYLMNCQEHIFMNNIIYQMQKEKKMDRKYKPKKLDLKGFDYTVRLKAEEESTDKEKSVDLSYMPSLGGGEEEVKKKD